MRADDAASSVQRLRRYRVSNTAGAHKAETTSSSGTETKQLSLVNAVNEALHIAMEADETACIFGEDVAFGGVFRATVGLQERFGQARVFNTPLSEQVSTVCVGGGTLMASTTRCV